MGIQKVELNLKAINKHIALFNCEQKVSGVIHTVEGGETTVIFDGGYLLGKFDCPHCAIEEISLLVLKIRDGDYAGWGTYRTYKQDFMNEAIVAVS